MKGDHLKWDKKYGQREYPVVPSDIVVDYFSLAKTGKALDLAAGMGRNSFFLSQRGFTVDAVDISEVALDFIRATDPKINVIKADLDDFIPETSRYDLVLNLHFLKRRLFPLIIGALKPKGVLIFQTFHECDDSAISQPDDFDLVLKKGELREAFEKLKVIHYREAKEPWKENKTKYVAGLVARKSGLAPIGNPSTQDIND